MKRLLATIRFLTILPTPGGRSDTVDVLAGTIAFFPLIGVLIGAAAAGLAVALWLLFAAAPPVASVLVVTALVAVSGGLHLDGLADTADGFFSSRPKERILEIMKDSHIGTFGTTAIFCVLALKVAALSGLPAADGAVWRAVFLMPLAGRCAMVVSMRILPSTTPGAGLGSVFCENGSTIGMLWALTVLGTAGWLLLGNAGLLAGAAAVVVTLLFSAQCYRKIGGATGDTLGATCELAEAAVAVTLAALTLRVT